MAVAAIGVISGLLTIVSFWEDNFAPAEHGSTIKVGVALEGRDGGPPTNTGGDLPDVRIWNDYGVFMGMTADPGSVTQGNVGEIKVDHDNQGVYSLFSANDDAICVAFVTTTWTEGQSNKYAVVGDYGKNCGGTWYYSGIYPTDRSDYQPACFWIDKNGDQPTTGFQVRWPAFSGDNLGDDNDQYRFCNDIDFGLRTEEDPNTINFWVKDPEASETSAASGSVEQKKTKKRAAPQQSAWMSEQLVLSDSEQQSATELCESDSSLGPDFANEKERVFCDMKTKTTYPFCEAEGTSGDCFDFESQTMSTTTVTGRFRAARSPRPEYGLVRDWRKGKNEA